MPLPQFDRSRLWIRPLAERVNKHAIEHDAVRPGTPPGPLAPGAEALIADTAARLRDARRAGRARILAFGAHTIKNGLGPVLIRLLERGWLTHLATNGAGIIHDWEFAYQGRTGEDVRRYAAAGQFGLWQETGFYLNLALRLGAYEGRGYGESVGALIDHERLAIPSAETLRRAAREALDRDPARAAAAADLLDALRAFELPPGPLPVPHPFKAYSVQAAAFRLGIPLTGHPMIGHDIIYAHPMNQGAAVGRTAERDFLAFADAVRRLDGGVYLSVGSAVMSPMIFEKAFSMAQNLRRQEGGAIRDHFILVVDLAASDWDWQARGEPPVDHPAYYLRFCKTFHRMGGTLRYLCADNRAFFLALDRALEAAPAGREGSAT